ncbi:MAG: helix-turn-helix transcriptional regulator [Bacteroidia bacterium]|nr:helix-turn-helix transcriptional regulator [Bacteroidia bacterium]
MRKIVKRSDCPISYSLDLLGDKWTMLILRDIAFSDKHFYKDFLEAGEGMATNVLADRLKMLKDYGIIESKQYELNKAKKYYTLTEKGLELVPMIIELWVWGAKHDPQSAVSKDELERRLSKREEIIESYKAKAKG